MWTAGTRLPKRLPKRCPRGLALDTSFLGIWAPDLLVPALHSFLVSCIPCSLRALLGQPLNYVLIVLGLHVKTWGSLRDLPFQGALDKVFLGPWKC